MIENTQYETVVTTSKGLVVINVPWGLTHRELDLVEKLMALVMEIRRENVTDKVPAVQEKLNDTRINPNPIRGSGAEAV